MKAVHQEWDFSMKKVIIVVFCIIWASLEAAEWTWAESIGGNNMERIWDICSDGENNLLVGGEYVDSLWISGQSFDGPDMPNSFIAKYTAEGELMWCNVLSSSSENCILGIGTDAQGNSYAGGYFVDTLQCQGYSVVSAGLWDAFVLKCNPLGELMWLRSFGGELNDIIHGLAVNSAGQIFAGGWFADTVIIDAVTSLNSYGGSDIMVLSLDNLGNALWARHAGTSGVDYGYKIACDEAANSYITGYASQGSNFDGLELGGSGMYVAKYNNLGDIQWILPSENAQVISIAAQQNANPQQYGAVAGRLSGVGCIGDFGFATVESSSDYYWATFDAINGEWTALEVHGGPGDDRGRDINFSPMDSMDPVVVGTLSENATFMGMEYLSHGADDLILYHPQFGAISAGGENSEIPYAVCQMNNGKLAIAGWHYGTFSLGNSVLDSGDPSDQNAFIACYNPFVEVQDAVQNPPRLTAWPNPFVNEIRVKAEPSSGNRLKIYNLKGQKVRTLESGSEFHWDGLDARGKALSPGIYILEHGGISAKVLKF